MQNTLIRVNFLEGVLHVERLIIIREALTKVSSDKLSMTFSCIQMDLYKTKGTHATINLTLLSEWLRKTIFTS